MKTNKEVNQILAEFMGDEGFKLIALEPNFEFKQTDIPIDFTDSLDSCVSVMEKLGVVISVSHADEIEKYEPTIPIDGVYRVHIYEISVYSGVYSDGETIQEATAHALVEAIEELEK